MTMMNVLLFVCVCGQFILDYGAAESVRSTEPEAHYSTHNTENLNECHAVFACPSMRFEPRKKYIKTKEIKPTILMENYIDTGVVDHLCQYIDALKPCIEADLSLVNSCPGHIGRTFTWALNDIPIVCGMKSEVTEIVECFNVVEIRSELETCKTEYRGDWRMPEASTIKENLLNCGYRVLSQCSSSQNLKEILRIGLPLFVPELI